MKVHLHHKSQGPVELTSLLGNDEDHLNFVPQLKIASFTTSFSLSRRDHLSMNIAIDRYGPKQQQLDSHETPIDEIEAIYLGIGARPNIDGDKDFDMYGLLLKP